MDSFKEEASLMAYSIYWEADQSIPSQGSQASWSLPVVHSHEMLDQNPQFAHLLLMLRQFMDVNGLSSNVERELQQAKKKMMSVKRNVIEQQLLYHEIKEVASSAFSPKQERHLNNVEDESAYSKLDQCLVGAEILQRLQGAATEGCQCQPSHELSQKDFLKVEDHKRVKEWLLPKLLQHLDEKCLLLFHYFKPDSEEEAKSKRSMQEAWKLSDILLEQKTPLLQEMKSLQFVLLQQKLQNIYLKSLLNSLAILDNMVAQCQLQIQSQADAVHVHFLQAKCRATCYKIRLEKLKILCDTYTPQKVEAQRRIRSLVEEEIFAQQMAHDTVTRNLEVYRGLGQSFSALVEEYEQLKNAADNQRWTLCEISKTKA
uniref:HAUS augmin-like complex subunit 4 isoform X2 n=1 Tax=Myxine glutinosa TaxID=7769 RepID=UPI00358F93A5